MVQWLNIPATVLGYWALANSGRLYVDKKIRRLVIPHFSVTDIRFVNPEALKNAGFKACVIDKDNTFTKPKELEVYPLVAEALEHIIDVFGRENVVIMSNSAGTRDDPHWFGRRLYKGEKKYSLAEAIEDNFGLKVIRHSGLKKPFAFRRVMEQLPGYEPYELFCMGDRVSTDTLLGTLNGMLTIHCEPFSEEEDIRTANHHRSLEIRNMHKLYHQGARPPEHPLYRPDLCTENLLEEAVRKITL